jgi:hypothetical protein
MKVYVLISISTQYDQDENPSGNYFSIHGVYTTRELANKAESELDVDASEITETDLHAPEIFLSASPLDSAQPDTVDC